MKAPTRYQMCNTVLCVDETTAQLVNQMARKTMAVSRVLVKIIVGI